MNTENDDKDDDDGADELFEAAAPTEFIDGEARPPVTAQGTALCLSGGGYRAALFHLGAVWALKRAGCLGELDRISSASGGSILAALLGLNWQQIEAEGARDGQVFMTRIVEPVLKLTSKTVDIGAGLCRLAGLHSLFDPFVHELDQLYSKRTLQDLPDRPRFVINATNVQSGALWRFMKPRMRDWRVGDIPEPTVRLSHAVAASAAYPPFLSPFILKTAPEDFVENSGQDLRGAKFRTRVMLTDAGVLDNLAVDTAWKKYDTLLISDAGWPLPAQHSPSMRWLGHTQRVVGILTHQLADIRQTQIKASFKIQRESEREGMTHPLGRKGAYWGITSRVESYTKAPFWVEDPVMLEKVKRLPTRLAAVPRLSKEYLIDWGYMLSRVALEKYFGRACPQPPPFCRIG